ncbi:MAG: c-type cytochrome, partial [Methylococcales bacterium]
LALATIAILGQAPRNPNAKFLLLVFAAIYSLSAFIVSAAAQSTTGIEAGKRIYREGVLPDGKSLRATVRGEPGVDGQRFNCATCHRRSGLGSSEGAAFVPPVTARWLFEPRNPRQIDLFKKLFQEVQPNRSRARLRDPRPRPAYTQETLSIALREGRDPTGREIDPLMPGYQLSDEDLRTLIAYLKTISATASEGVSDSTIHFATVVAQGADAEKRAAMMDVFEAYFRWKNADTRRLLDRPRSVVWYKDEFYAAARQWKLHVWELNEREETWPAQLEAYYRQQPVFALIGGIAEEWRAVHDFCERKELPCLFPRTDLPGTSPAVYSIYFSRGLTLEAEALANYVRDKMKAARIVQVYRASHSGLEPARAFRRGLENRDVNLKDYAIKGGREITREFWEKFVKNEKPSSLVLWLSDVDLKSLNSPQDLLRGVERIYLSSSLLEEIPAFVAGLREKILLTHPFALRETPHVYRVRAWMRSRGMAMSHEQTQLNTYFTLSLIDHALARMADNFYRDYFLETIEQETENETNPGVFPTLSLGPGQRFASRGCYIVRLTDKGGFEAVSGWIVP